MGEHALDPGARAALSGLGFWRGFSTMFAALRGLTRLPAAWPYALVPTFVFALLEAGAIAVSVRYLQPWVEAWLGGGGALQTFGAQALSWISVLLCAVLGWIVAAFLTPPLSAPALERIVTLVERQLGLPERKSLGFIAEFWCGARSLLLGGVVTLPIVLVLTLLELFVPALSVVTTPLKLTIGALGLAWGLFDYPLTLRGIGARSRLALMRRNITTVFGFGVAFALLFWAPCCGVVMLPVGVAAATSLLARIDERERASALREAAEVAQ